MAVLKELMRVRAEDNRSLGWTDRAFREELERGFEGLAEGLNIPVWLNTKIAQESIANASPTSRKPDFDIRANTTYCPDKRLPASER